MKDIPEAERYDRQIGIDGFGLAGQERLGAARVTIAGAGGLGSPQAIYMTVAGVGHITILDLDRVTPSNLNRQILHWEEDLGRPKVDSAGEKLRRLNSRVTIEAERVRIADDNVDGFVAGRDLVLDAMDNRATRKILNRACQRHGVPYVFGGVIGLTGMIMTVLPGRTACLECIFPDDAPDAPVPVLGATPGVVGSLQVTEAIKHIVGLGRPLYDRLLIYNGMDMSFKEIAVHRDERCPACGNPG